MKKIVVLISIMIVFFLTLFLMSDSFAASSTKPKAPLTPAGTANPQTAPATSQKPNIPGGIKTFRSAQITVLEIETDPSGTWFWKVTVKNTGTATLNGMDLTVQGMCISFPPAQNAWKAASGSIVGAGTLAPNQTADVKNFWTRCCLTTELKVELRDKISNKIWDTKSVSNLIYSTAPMKPLNLRVKRIEWDDSVKGWKATIKNNTNYTLKMNVQGDLLPAANPNAPVPTGGQQLTLGPQAEVVTMQLHAATAKHGDVLRVHIGLIMGSGACNEAWENCGGKPSNNITIPNSANF
jgi:hypothetical protein